MGLRVAVIGELENEILILSGAATSENDKIYL